MARKQSPALTDAESAVMVVLWRLRRASVGDVVTAMNQTRAVTYSTVQTLLRLRETRGYGTHGKVARAFVYELFGEERRVWRHSLRHLVRRLFEGSPSLLVLNVLQDEELDPAEREHLRKLIERA